MITAEFLNTILIYDAENGVFQWKVDRSRRVKAGMIAGSPSSEGYVTIGIKGRNYKAHRLAWLIAYGHWPTNLVDHINGNRADNRLANLREASNSENLMNSKVRVESRSGTKGVSERVNFSGKPFHAYITKDGKRKHLGSFSSKEEAAAMYQSAARQMFGEYARV